jgi:hypothetical protein
LLSRISLATSFGPLGPKLFLWSGFFISHRHGSVFLIEKKAFFGDFLGLPGPARKRAGLPSSLIQDLVPLPSKGHKVLTEALESAMTPTGSQAKRGLLCSDMRSRVGGRA